MDTKTLAQNLDIHPRAYEDDTDWEAVKRHVTDFCQWGLDNDGLIEPPNRWYPKAPLGVKIDSSGREKTQPTHQPGCAPTPSQLKKLGGMHATATRERVKNVLAVVRIRDEAQEQDIALVLTFLLRIEEYPNESVITL